MRIFALQTHCGCLSASLAHRGKPYVLGDPVKAKDLVELHVVLSPQMPDSERIIGIDLLTNDPQFASNPTKAFGMVELRPKFRATSGFTIEGTSAHSTIDLGRFGGSEGTALDAWITDKNGQSIDSIEAISNVAHVATSLTPSWGNLKWKLSITVAPGCPEGALSGSIDLSLRRRAEDREIRRRLFVIGRSEGRLSVSPPDGIRLGVVSSSGTPLSSLRIRDRKHEPLKVRHIRLSRRRADAAPADPLSRSSPTPDSAEDALDYEVLEGPDGAMDVHLRMKDNAPAGSLLRFLYIEVCAGEDTSTIEVPITGYYKR